MSGVNVYGDIITLKMVRKAVQANVEAWIPDYLAEVAEGDGRDRDALPPFRSYFPVVQLDNFVENQLPACVIVAPGTMSNGITKRVKGIDARFAIGLGAVVSAMDEESTYELAELYGAALMSIMVQHPSCGGFATGFTFTSMTVEVVGDSNAGRTLMAAIVQGGLDVNGIVDPAYGPTAPSGNRVPEPPDWPVIETVESTVTATGVDA